MSELVPPAFPPACELPCDLPLPRLVMPPPDDPGPALDVAPIVPPEPEPPDLPLELLAPAFTAD